MNKYNYQARIILYAAILFLLFGSIIVLVQRSTERQIKTEALELRLEEMSDCLHTYLSDKVDSVSHLPTQSHIAAFVRLLPRDLRFTIISAQGDVIFDNVSGGSLPENHLRRAEIQTARLQGIGSAKRYSDTLHKEFYYLAKNYDQYFVRIAIPYEIQYSNYFRTNNFFLLLVIAIFSLALIAVFYFTTQFDQSVRALRSFVSKANALGEHQRVPFPDTELGRLGEQVQENFRLLEQSKTRYEMEREKLIQHFSNSDEGIAFFSSERTFIYANSHFVQNLNNLIDAPTLVIDERILDIPILQSVRHLLRSDERSIRYIAEHAGTHIEVRAQKFPDDSFEIVLTNITQKENDRRLKHDMTNSIAHELRTPVSCARGYLETILNQSLPEDKQHYFVERTYHQMLRLSQLISDVSMITKMEEAADLYTRHSISPHNVVEEVKAALELKLAEAHISIDNQLPDDCLIYANHSLLYAIFANLAENSIRYAGDGATIEIRLTMEDAQFCYFSFADDGPGISDSESLSKIFDRFYRIEQSRSRDQGGSGLGLSIVRNAVRYHGGEISAKNRPNGGGLEFFFSLAKGE